MVKSDQPQLGNIIICINIFISHWPRGSLLGTSGRLRDFIPLKVEGVKENFSQYLKKTLEMVAPPQIGTLVLAEIFIDMPVGGGVVHGTFSEYCVPWNSVDTFTFHAAPNCCCCPAAAGKCLVCSRPEQLSAVMPCDEPRPQSISKCHIACNFLHLSSRRCFLLIVSAA